MIQNNTKSYKFRLYPNAAQIALIICTFGCCRFVYNYFLALRRDTYSLTGETLEYTKCSGLLTALKNDHPWLKDVDSTALQSTLRNLDCAYANFFNRVKQHKYPYGYPKFKSRKNHRQSYTSKNNHGTIKVLDDAVKLPKLGIVKCRVSREVEGRILNATVEITPSGKFFIAICCADVEHEQPPKTGKTIGLDFGIKSLITTSDGALYPNLKTLYEAEKNLKHQHHVLSRKTRGSERYEKQRVKLAKAYEKVTALRGDYIQKLTTNLIRQYDIIAVEDLAPSNMVKNHHLAKAVEDASFREIRRELEYKAAWYGKEVVFVDRFYPSSQTCSSCGVKWPGAKDLGVREWTCPSCGTYHDRDVNAAINILNEGIRLISA